MMPRRSPLGPQRARAPWALLALSASCASCLLDFDPAMLSADAGAGGDAGTKPDATTKSPYVDAVMADGPSAYWRFGEPSGTIAKDSSGHGNDGAYMGRVMLGAKGAIVDDQNAAASFDGVTAFADFGDRFGFAGNAPFSVELWVKPHQIGTSWSGLVTKEVLSPTREGWVFFMQESMMDGFGLDRWVNGVAAGVATGPPPTEAYTYVVATYDGATLVLHVDGSAVASHASAAALTVNTGKLVVGARYSGTEGYAPADIDEVAIYDHALEEARIAAHYAAATSP